MLDQPRIFKRSDPDFPTTQAAINHLVAASRVEGEGPLANRPHRFGAGRYPPANPHLSAATATADFPDADRSLIRHIGPLVPRTRLLTLLNERRQADLGASAVPYTMDQLDQALSKLTTPRSNTETSWAHIRKLLAHAHTAGTLDYITEQTVRDFAVVYSLSPKQLMRLLDIVLPEPELAP